MQIDRITRARFDALCYSREPSLFYAFDMEELAWFEAFEKKLLAIVARYGRRGFGFVILGRDARNLFRYLDSATELLSSEELAISELFRALESFANDGQLIYPQGDESELPNEILEPVVDENLLHPYFKRLISQKTSEGARTLIKEAVYAFNDVDGNYIKDFQTTGFDARLWELYLHLYLKTSGFDVSRDFKAPDFLVSFLGKEAAIEAVSVNSNKDFDESCAPKDEVEMFKLNCDYMPIKFGSPLTSKLKKLHKGKRYWELDHVIGKPLILAIHDYHLQASKDSLGSMTWSREGLLQYLYGVRMKTTVEDGKVHRHLKATESGVEPIYENIITHTWKRKSIPSGFFKQPDAENISAVLFTNNATIGTFNRMGKLAGFCGPEVKMTRFGTRYNPDPFATAAIPFTNDIDDPAYEESWAETIMIYHNPQAKIPLDPQLFPDVSHAFFQPSDNSLSFITRPYDVLSSITVTQLLTKSD